MKNLFKIANWCVVGIIVEVKNIIINYKFDARFGCTCSHCGERMKKHILFAQRTISRDFQN